MCTPIYSSDWQCNEISLPFHVSCFLIHFHLETNNKYIFDESQKSLNTFLMPVLWDFLNLIGVNKRKRLRKGIMPGNSSSLWNVVSMAKHDGLSHLSGIPEQLHHDGGVLVGDGLVPYSFAGIVYILGTEGAVFVYNF